MPQPNHMPPAAPPAVRAPICEICDTPMKLARVKAHERYTNLDEWSYTCECGARVSQLVARK
jgi:hypothetical protein